MTLIVGKNKNLKIKGKFSDFENAFNKFNDSKVEKLIFNMEQNLSTSKKFLSQSKKMKKIFSHVAILKINDKLLAISDGFINIEPGIKVLSNIVSNAIFTFDKISHDIPKVAVLSAVEIVTPAMDSSIPASVMEAMGKRHQFGKNVFVEGPLSIDVAISAQSAKEKKVETDVAGKANILIGHKSTIPNGIISALKLYGKPDFLISIVTDGVNIFPFILDMMEEKDIENTLEFCS